MQMITSVAVMRDSDQAEIARGTDSKLLMYRAGTGLLRSLDWHGKIDIVTGSGNNAGDGYVLALLLQKQNIPCRIVRASTNCSPDGAHYLAQCQNAGIPVTEDIVFSQTDIIADCLLGTGFQGELRPRLRDVIRQINDSTAFVCSVDINSGMNGDTGEDFCVRSDLTVSIGTLQYGHLAGLHRGVIQSLCNYDIGIPCIGPSMPLYAPDETLPAESDCCLPPPLRTILDSAGIPPGTPEQRLQAYTTTLWKRIRFCSIFDSGYISAINPANTTP